MLAALDRINNYEEVLREFKVRKQSEESGGMSSMASVVNASQAETRAAVAIQSAFKGYKIRKEIKEIQTFYKQVSGSEDQIAGLSLLSIFFFIVTLIYLGKEFWQQTHVICRVFQFQSQQKSCFKKKATFSSF